MSSFTRLLVCLSAVEWAIILLVNLLARAVPHPLLPHKEDIAGCSAQSLQMQSCPTTSAARQQLGTWLWSDGHVQMFHPFMFVCCHVAAACSMSLKEQQQQAASESKQ